MLLIQSHYSFGESVITIPKLISLAKQQNLEYLVLSDVNLCGSYEFANACKANNIKPIISLRIIYDNITIVAIATNTSAYRIICEMSYQKRLIINPNITYIILSENINDEILTAMPPGNAYIGIVNNVFPFKDMWNKKAEELSYKHRIPKINVKNMNFLNVNERSSFYVLRAIHSHRRYIPDEVEWGDDRFYEHPSQVWKNEQDEIHVNKIIGDCTFRFEKTSGFPDAGTKPLKELVSELTPKRYESITQEILDRIRYEYKIINKMGFSPYFLIIYDLLDYCSKNGIPYGPGRGSVAGCIIAYILGITYLNPLQYDLLFERFLNPERVSMPDIDLDFCQERRQDVIDYIYKKYGNNNVSQIGTFVMSTAKAIVKDVGRAYGYDFQELNLITKLIPSEHGKIYTLSQAINAVPELEELYADTTSLIYVIFNHALFLEGVARQISKHAAGILISAQPIADIVPLITLKDGSTVTQFSGPQCEALGLLKIDILGLKNITILHDSGYQPAEIPTDDARVYDTLGRGENMGIFQLNSPGMRKLLMGVKPNRFEDIIDICAIYRPGPLGSGMDKMYIENRINPDNIEYMFPCLKPILEPTYGVILYHEQIMQIAQTVAGFSLGKADVMRRAIGKKKKEELDKIKYDFIRGGIENGYNDDMLEILFKMIYKFANYGFNKSHSAAYALISYWTVYQRIYHPLEYIAALLNFATDADKFAEIIKYCHLNAIGVIMPKYGQMTAKCTVVNGEIMLGLNMMPGFGDAMINDLLELQCVPYNMFLKEMKVVTYKNAYDITQYGMFDWLMPRKFQHEMLLRWIVGDDLDFPREPHLLKCIRETDYDCKWYIDEELKLFGCAVTRSLESSIVDNIHSEDELTQMGNGEGITIAGVVEGKWSGNARKDSKKYIVRAKLSSMKGTIDIVCFDEFIQGKIQNGMVLNARGRVSQSQKYGVSVIVMELIREYEQEVLPF